MQSRVNDSSRAIRAAWLLSVLTFALLVIWSFIVPIFESPDEPAHWQYVRHLHDAHELPVYSSAFVEATGFATALQASCPRFRE